MAFVRHSKFRHVYGQAVKKEQCYDNVRITKSAWDGPFCTANPKWLATLSDANGSSSFYVIDLSKTGRLEVDSPMVSGHKGQVLELQWCPHDDDIIASAGEDCVVKVWRIPSEGLTSSLTEPVVSLMAHQRRVGNLLWHPTAANVLVSAGQEGRVIVWDVSKAEPAIVFDLPAYALSLSFNYIGSKLAVTCKDKMLRVLDIRAKKILQEGQAHDGSKPSICVYTRDDQIFTTGFSKMSKRCYALWNDNDLSKPVVTDEIDSSNGTLFPYYDYDLSLLFLIGKGDSLIRYFEITNEAPFVHYLNLYSSSEPQRGFGYMPKRGVNVHINEVVRIFKMHARNWVEVIHFMVPRKSEMYQDDLYPDTISDAPVLTAEQWLAGQNAQPLLTPMRDAEKFYGPGKPAQNRILTSAVASSGAVSLPPLPTPNVESNRWSAYVPQNNLSADSAHASRNHSKEPSPATSAVAPSPRPQVVQREQSQTNGSSANSHTNGTAHHPPAASHADEVDSRSSPTPVVPPDFDFHAVQNDIKKLKIIAKGQESRIKSVEDRCHQSGPEDSTERFSQGLREQEQRIHDRYSQILAEQDRRIKLLEERVARLALGGLPRDSYFDGVSNEVQASPPTRQDNASSNPASPQLQQQLIDSISGLTAQLEQLASRFSAMEKRLENVEKLLLKASEPKPQKSEKSAPAPSKEAAAKTEKKEKETKPTAGSAKSLDATIDF